MDCEMVFTSEGFEQAQVMILAVNSCMLLDNYMKLQDCVCDRMQFSGIIAQHMVMAVSFGKAI